MISQAIKINNLTCSYSNKIILKNISFTVENGNFTAICGPNGVGKTTIIKYLVKELNTKSSSIFLFDKDINQIKQKDLPKYISYVGQNDFNKYSFTVKELIEMGKYGNNESKISTDEAIQIVDINHLKNKFINSISSGEIQLAQIARAVCQDAKIMILDEPISNLDPYHQIKIMEILRALNKNNKTIICVLHDLNIVLKYCPYCLLLKNGNIFKNGKTEDVLKPNNISNVYNINCEIFKTNHGQLQLAFYNNQC